MYVDIRATYVVQAYQPLVHNFYPYVEQRPNREYFTKLYGISSPTNTVRSPHSLLFGVDRNRGRGTNQYRFVPLPL